MGERGPGRLFKSVTPSVEDLARARALPRTACPRRYCWWWQQSLGFDWDTPEAEGCMFLRSPKPPGFRFPVTPCCRCDPSSGIDQYEPREPHLEADGFHPYHFCGPQHHLQEGEGV